MNSSPSISVILSAYNAAFYLRESVESILSQTFSDFELIVVDDGSTDGTFNIISEYRDNRIVCLQNEFNRGLTISLNLALGISRGKYIARQDADDYSFPERLQKQVEYMEAHPQLGLLGTGSIWLDETTGTKLHRQPLTDDEQLQPALLQDNCFDHGSVMFRRECLNEVGGKYSEIHRYSQDYHLWLRMAEAWQIGNLSDELYVHRIHPSMISTVHQAEQRSTKAHIQQEILDRRLASGTSWIFRRSKDIPAWMSRLSRQEISRRYLLWTTGVPGNFYRHKMRYLLIAWLSDPGNLELYRYLAGVWQRKTALRKGA